MLTLKNSFHGREVRIRRLKSFDELDALNDRADKGDREAQIYRRRIKRKLCPSPGCVCGDSWGIRP